MPRDTEFGQIEEEIHRRFGRGEIVDEAAFLRDYPQHRAELEELFELDRLLRPRTNQPFAGARIGSAFEIIQPIGRGGMGRVFEAEQIALRRRVALKTVPLALVTERGLARFRREAEATAGLHHPHIVPIHAFGEDPHYDVAFIAMELVEGISFAVLLDTLIGHKKPQPTEQDLVEATGLSVAPDSRSSRPHFRHVVQWIAQIADALDAAHQQKIVHRDVKPGNILLRRDDTPLLTDFGLARADDDSSLTKSGDFFGSPAYMSPEQVRGDYRSLDARTDVYSLGVTLYQMLGLELPFNLPAGEELTRAILEREPAALRSRNPRIPKELDAICAKAMRKEPNRRYESARAFGDDLRRFLRGEPILARPVGRISRGWRSVWRHRRAIAISALVLLAVGGAGWGVLAGRLQRTKARENAVREARAALDRGDPDGAVPWLRSISESDWTLGDVQPVRDATLDAFVARWKNATDKRDQSLVASSVAAMQSILGAAGWPGSRWAKSVEAHAFLGIVSEPSGAAVNLYRYLPESAIVQGGDDRLVPVPCDRENLFKPRLDWASADVRPGAVCLVVESVERGSEGDRAGLRPGDLIRAVDGVPVDRALYVGSVTPDGFADHAHVRAFERLLFIDGKPATRFLDYWNARWSLHRGSDVEVQTEAHRYAVRGGPEEHPGFLPYTAELVLGDPNRTLDRPWVLSVRKSGRTESAKPERLESVTVAAGVLGLRCWTTSCPLLGDDSSVIGTTPRKAVSLDAGSYLLVVSHEGFEDQRYPVLLACGESTDLQIPLLRAGTTPPGFVHLPRFQAILGGDEAAALDSLPRTTGVWIEPCWIARDELSCEDYRRFMRSPEVQALLPRARRADGVILCPREDSRLMESDFDAAWSEFLREDILPKAGLRGITVPDGLEYVKWLGTSQPLEGGLFFDFPDETQWEACARGADGRIHPWGDALDWRYCVGWSSTGDAATGGALPPSGSVPMDESPFGVRDLMGGACAEWCRTTRVNAQWVLRGGTCRRSDRAFFHAATRILKGPAMVWEGTAGVRLALRRR